MISSKMIRSMNKKSSLLLLLAFTTVTIAQATTMNKAITNGTNWSSTSTWSLGRLPANGDSIVIPAGYTVWLDINATLNNVYLTIAGTLEVDKNSGLTLDNNSVVGILNGGSLSTTHPSSTEIISIGGVNKYVGSVDGTITGPKYASSATGTSPSGFSTTTVTLPVTFVSFTAVRSDNEDVTLDWTTVSETSNSHFDVERSLDGAQWTTIGTVAAGAVNVENNYNFNDAMASANEISYRLRQVDIDGNAQYSRTVTVAGTAAGKTTIVAAGKTINITFTRPTSATITARLISLNGQVLQQETFGPATSTISLGESRVSGGIYVVYLSDGKGWSIAKKILL